MLSANVTRCNVSLERSQLKGRLRPKPRTYMDSFSRFQLFGSAAQSRPCRNGITRPIMDGSDLGRNDANNTRETRSARTGSVKNQSCSLQRETQCCAEERIEDVGAKPTSRVEVSAQFRLVQTAARYCGNPLSARCRVVGTDGVEAGGSFSCWQ